MESAGYCDLLKFGILGLLDALIPKIYLTGSDFCSLRVTSFVTATFHLGTITKIYTRAEVFIILNPRLPCAPKPIKKKKKKKKIRAAPAHAVPPSHMGIILQKCWFCYA